MTFEQLIERLKALAAEWSGKVPRGDDEYGAGSESGKHECAEDLMALIAEATGKE